MRFRRLASRALRRWCLALALGLAGAALPAKEGPDLVLEGELDGRDHQTYRLVPFDVPAGVARLTVEFIYTGREKRTTIDLGLLGPDGFRGTDGFRGWSGGNKSVFTISATDATPSYRPGPITPGRWQLLLGVPNIRGDVRANFTANVHFSRTTAVADEPALLRRSLREGPAWYRGDLHVHTAHSDGYALSQGGQRVGAPPFLVAEAAVGRGLDFVAITDHNTTSHAQAIRELQPYFDRLLLIPGRELTTFQGHANIFGTSELADFRVRSGEVPDWDILLREVGRLGALVSINHPIRPSGEECMGCGWTPDPAVDLARVNAVEIVNGRDADTPFSGVVFWHEQLNQGFRLVGIGGSDTHGWRIPPSPDAVTLGVGHPTTVVHARELSTLAIMEGIRAGRVFVDVSGSTDRLLEFSARSGGADAVMGGAVDAAAGSRVTFTVRVRNAAGARVEFLVDGRPAAHVDQPSLATADESRSLDWPSDGRRHWLRVNVRDHAGKLLLIGNPIYVNDRPL